MNIYYRRLLIANGSLVFLLGLAAGFPYAFVLTGVEFPGDVRGWRMAHLEGVLNGLLLFAVAAAATSFRLRPRAEFLVVWGLIVTAWGNIIASTLSPLFDARGLTFGGGMNSVVYLLFVAAIIGVVVAVALVGWNAWTQRHEGGGG